jgi:hypothetical protein
MMKADDPRLEKARQEAIERVKRVDEMMVTVLKNHLVVEQFMDEFLLASGKKADGKFSDKIDRCRGLKPPEFTDKDWAVLSKANQLRNKIGHTLDQAEIKAKMDEVRVAYLAALSDEQRPHSEKLDDVRIAAAAFEHCGAYMVAATETARAAKKP